MRPAPRHHFSPGLFAEGRFPGRSNAAVRLIRKPSSQLQQAGITPQRSQPCLQGSVQKREGRRRQPRQHLQLKPVTNGARGVWDYRRRQDLCRGFTALHPAGASSVKPGELFCNTSETSSFALATKSPVTVPTMNAGGGVQSPGCYCHTSPFSLAQGEPLLPGSAWPRGTGCSWVGFRVLLVTDTRIWVRFLLGSVPQVGLGRRNSAYSATAQLLSGNSQHKSVSRDVKVTSSSALEASPAASVSGGRQEDAKDSTCPTLTSCQALSVIWVRGSRAPSVSLQGTPRWAGASICSRAGRLCRGVWAGCIHGPRPTV